MHASSSCRELILLVGVAHIAREGVITWLTKLSYIRHFHSYTLSRAVKKRACTHVTKRLLYRENFSLKTSKIQYNIAHMAWLLDGHLVVIQMVKH